MSHDVPGLEIDDLRDVLIRSGNSYVESALNQARNDRQSEENRLALALQHHKEAVNEHIEKWTERAKAAEAKAVATARAREILQQLPGAAALGPARGFHARFAGS